MNGLRLIRKRCNFSLSELAEVLSVSRQQISAWENGKKSIPAARLAQLSEYFGIDENYFLEISEEDRASILAKALYLRQDWEKEVYSFRQPTEKSVGFRDRPIYYCSDSEESLDAQLARAKNMEKETLEGVQEALGYFGKPTIIADEISAIDRGCKVYDALTRYLRQMVNTAPGTSVLYYNMARNVLFALLVANGLMGKEELEAEFRDRIGSPLYDDMDWINAQAEIFKKQYTDKVTLVKNLR